MFSSSIKIFALTQRSEAGVFVVAVLSLEAELEDAAAARVILQR